MLVKFMVLMSAFVACGGLTIPPQLAAKAEPAAMPRGTTPHATPLPSPPIQVPKSSVYCGETPDKVYWCLGSPKFFNHSIAVKCMEESLSECDRIKCTFRDSGWSTSSSTKDDTVNKPKVAEYFNQYAVDNPGWSAAVEHLKAACLDKDLPAQGPAQNCAAYDVLHCIITSFMRNALPTQWRNAADCAYPRAYASACPICPTACFAPQVPYGTCNACRALPSTP